jgi:hypothetical protein
MKARAWKKLALILGILALVFITVGTVTPMLLDLNRYHGFIVSEVETAVGGKVKLGHISWGVTHRLWLEVDGFSITDASAFSGDVNFTRIYTSVSIPQLLAKKVVLQTLQLESSEVKFRLEPAAKDTDPSASGTTSAGVDLPVEIEIQQLAVAVKRFEIDDALSVPGQTLMHVFADVDLTATNIAPAKVMTFNLSLRDKSPSGFGALKVQGSFSGLTNALTLDNPNLKLQASLNTLHVDAIKPYIKNSQLNRQLAGSISMEVNYQGDLGQNLRAQGDIDLSQLMYSNPSFWDAALPGQNTTVTFQINLDPQNLTAEKITLKLGTLSLDARGVLHSWNKEPVVKNVEITSDLPLGDLIPLIPWKQMGTNAGVIRPILEEGGRIVVDKLILPEISFAKLPATMTDLVSEIQMTAQLAGVSLQPTSTIPKIQNIEGTVQLANGIVQVQGLTARIASVDLPPVSAEITNLVEQPKIDAKMNGRLKLDAIADEKLRELLKNIGLENVVGAADVDLTVKLDTARPSEFQLQGTIGLKEFQVKTVYAPALLHGLNAQVAIKPALVNISKATAIVSLPAAAASADDHFTLDIEGHIDDWRSDPSVTLQNFKTSQISLPLLASMVPWEKLDQSAKPVKEILNAGGFIAIESLSFPAINLSNLSKDAEQLLPRVKLAARLTNITVPRGLLPTKIEVVTGRINLEKNVLVAENVHSKLGPIALPDLEIRATDIADHFKVALRAKGPLQVAATGDKQVEKLLLEHGLKSLSVSADIDVSADFDQRNPKDWTANGSLIFHDARVQTHPAAVVMDGLKGHLLFSRKKTMNMTAQNITARINQAPVRLSGKFLHIGSPEMLVSASAHATRLDLSDLAELLPALKEMKLEGMLEMDVDLHVRHSAPEKIRLKGSLSTRNVGFRLASSNLAVAKGNVDLELSAQSANIKTMTMQVNDQKVALSGQMSNPVEPKIKLLVTSPDLNLDRLLPPDKAAKPSSTPSTGKEDQSAKKPATDTKAGKAELPPMARKLTADIQLHADRGQYKGVQFKKLKLDLLYKRGVIESYDVIFGVDEGHIAAKGSADLRDLTRIGFTVDPDISALPLETVTSALGIDNLPLNGPLTLKGQLRGRTGNTREILGSLNGTLDASLGPGNLSNVGKAGEFFAKLSSMVDFSGLSSGRLFKDIANQGIPFETITAQASFDKGTLNLSKLHFGSDAMTVDGQGKIDLINQTLKMETHLVPLVTVDQALHYVPIVGEALEDVTKIHIDIEGPLGDPTIHTAEAREIGKGIETEVGKPKTILEDVGEGLEKIF